MSDVSFKCPDCGHDLVERSGREIESIDDIENTICNNCGRVIHKDDVISQTRQYAERFVRDMLGKNFK